MARDYKHRAQPRQASTTAPPWVWFITGIMVGGFIVGLAWLKMAPSAGGQWIGAGPENQNALSSKEKKRSVPKPTFDFYTLLPEMEIVVPEEEIPKETVEINLPRQQTQQKKPQGYLLQVGSFKKAADAERLKAQLALIGLHASIQKARINNGELFHRVRAGQYRGAEELQEARRVLADNSYRSITIKVK